MLIHTPRMLHLCTALILAIVNLLTGAVDSYTTPGDIDDSSSPTPPTSLYSNHVEDSSIEVFLYDIQPSLPWSPSASITPHYSYHNFIFHSACSYNMAKK